MVVFNDVVGVQVYVFAPLAVSVAVCPAQIVDVVGVIFNIGIGFTTTVILAVSVHVPLVPVTI